MLTVPSDEVHWQQMQKGLVPGGVYHVQMPTGQRKYCLWNGKQLVPCKLLFLQLSTSLCTRLLNKRQCEICNSAGSYATEWCLKNACFGRHWL